MTKGLSISASHAVDYLLTGATFDHFRVYSSSLVLCFRRFPGIASDKPDEVWVSSTGFVEVGRMASVRPVSAERTDQRGPTIGSLSQLIAEEVSSAQVWSVGHLELMLGDCWIRMEAEEVNTEEVWSVTTDSPDPSFPHRWSITLDDVGNVVVHSPEEK